jgi:hypothetical protein
MVIPWLVSMIRQVSIRSSCSAAILAVVVANALWRNGYLGRQSDGAVFRPD